jgi:polyhydroxybutyrate depolymerase
MTERSDRTTVGRTIRLKRRCRWPLAVLILAAGCGRTAWTDPDRILSIEHFHDRSWRAMAPAVPPAPGGLAPLILVFHGASGSGPVFQAYVQVEATAGPLGIYVVYPTAAATDWNGGYEGGEAAQAGVDDRQFIRSLTAHLVETLPIDPARIYLVGFSSGGLFAHYMGATDFDHRLAGIASVSAGMAVETPHQRRRSRRLPVLMVNGTTDGHVPWTRDPADPFYVYTPLETADFWAGFNGCREEPTEEVLPDAGLPLLQVRILRWAGCAPTAPVVLYAIEGGRHTWYANAEIDVSQVVVAFFAGLED